MWRDLKKIDGDPIQSLEAKRFWACFMMQFILPPVNDRPKWNLYISDRNKPTIEYEPQCRYDEFVASHASACNHDQIYFAYYHRNLMSKFTFALQEADLVLRGKDSKTEQWIRSKGYVNE